MGTSVALAAAGIAAITVLPQAPTQPARLKVPVAVDQSVAAASSAPTSAGDTAGVKKAPLLPAHAIRVQIPALGVTSSIMDLGLQSDGSMQVPAGAYPVGWYTGSPIPGQIGPAVLAGHVDWEGEPGAFYGLRELRPGDAIVIDRADGTTVTFEVERVEEHRKAEFPTEDVYGDIDHAGLRLITCGGAFEEATGDYQDNVIIFARMVTPV